MSDLVRVVFLLFLQCIGIVQVVTVVRRSEGNAISEHAASLCTLATPDVIYSNGGLFLNVSTDEFHPAIGEKLWVGYGKVFEAFQYRGCSLNSAITFTRDQNIEASPGYCYSFCGTEHIGLFGTICYCIPTLYHVDLTLPACATPCSHQPDALCGGQGGLTSIYTKVEYYPYNNNRPDYVCLALKPAAIHSGATTIEWSNCSDDYRTVCVEASSNSTIPFNAFNNWSTSMPSCTIIDGVPAFIYTNFNDIAPPLRSNAWIGEIRSLVIKRITVDSNDEVRSHGYTELRSGKLLFEENTSDQHKALCFTNATDSFSTTTTDLITESTTTTDLITELTTTTDLITESTTTTDLITESTSRGTSLNHEESLPLTETTEYTSSTSAKGTTTDSTSIDTPTNHDDSMSLIVALAVALPVVLFVLAVIIVCCICKRRKKSAIARKENQFTNQHTTVPDLQGGFFNLEPVNPKENASLQRTQNDGEYELADEFVAPIHNKPTADDTYDHTTDLEKPAPKGEHIYNKPEQCNTYDTNDTYDHTHDREGQVMVTENVYNKTESEDTYDTTGRNKALKPGTDNIYNMTQSDDMYNTPGEATGVIFNTDNVYDTTNNDAYSQIDRKKVPASKTEK